MEGKRLISPIVVANLPWPGNGAEGVVISKSAAEKFGLNYDCQLSFYDMRLKRVMDILPDSKIPFYKTKENVKVIPDILINLNSIWRHETHLTLLMMIARLEVREGRSCPEMKEQINKFYPGESHDGLFSKHYESCQETMFDPLTQEPLKNPRKVFVGVAAVEVSCKDPSLWTMAERDCEQILS